MLCSGTTSCKRARVALPSKRDKLWWEFNLRNVVKRFVSWLGLKRHQFRLCKCLLFNQRRGSSTPHLNTYNPQSLYVLWRMINARDVRFVISSVVSMVNKVNLVGLVEWREAFMDKCLIVLYFMLVCRFRQEQNCSFLTQAMHAP